MYINVSTFPLCVNRKFNLTCNHWLSNWFFFSFSLSPLTQLTSRFTNVYTTSCVCVCVCEWITYLQFGTSLIVYSSYHVRCWVNRHTPSKYTLAREAASSIETWSNYHFTWHQRIQPGQGKAKKNPPAGPEWRNRKWR